MEDIRSYLIITYVFSDIEHSTRLAQKLLDGYPKILEQHRSVIRAAINKYKGEEIDTAGDGFFMVFKDPKSAVLATFDIQQEFHSKEWATSIGLKVRMGIHTGVALTTKSGYTGVEVHLASRICNAANGGQVLVSDATKKLMNYGLEAEISLSDLGEYKLKDFAEAVKLFQLNIGGIDSQFSKPRVEQNEKKIAVLPFTNLSNNPDRDYLSEGLAEELIVALGKVNGLRVASRSSAFAFKDEDRDAKEVGQKLDVNSVLAGRIKSYNDDIRITVELVDTITGLNIWSGQYDSSKEHLVQFQDEITKKITEALDCNLVSCKMDFIKTRQTYNAEAYHYYLRGRRFYLQFSTGGVELAIKMFEKAIKEDNEYALAYAGLADCYSYKFQHTDSSPEIILKADNASNRAMTIAPTLAEAYVSRGIAKTLLEQFDEAEELFQFAIERDPTLFLGWFQYARTCFTLGKLDKAARLFEQANRVEPEDYQSVLLAAQAYADIGSEELAETLRIRGVGIAEKYLELNPGDIRALCMAANGLAFLNQSEKCLNFIQRALFLDPHDSMVLYNAGCVYALLGMKSEAITCIERSYDAGLTLKGWYENDSNLDSIRSEPQFIELIEQLNEK